MLGPIAHKSGPTASVDSLDAFSVNICLFSRSRRVGGERLLRYYSTFYFLREGLTARELWYLGACDGFEVVHIQ